MGIHCGPVRQVTEQRPDMLTASLLVVSTTGHVLPPQQDPEDPNYFLLPLTMLEERGEDYEDVKQGEDPYQPTNEEVLEALLSQLDNPDESEQIYNSLIRHSLEKKDSETLQHQLNVLKSESFNHPDIDYRKHQDQDQDAEINLKRRKRSTPPFVDSMPILRRRMH